MENRNNNPIAEEIIHNNPTGYGLFAGIGDNFNSAAQAICELADDAISNLRANSDDPDLSMTIVVSFENLGDAVEISVVDGGTGITNLDSALTIACRDGAQTPLNEHGFGLKHALASCDSSPSQQWSIRTRTKRDAAANQYADLSVCIPGKRRLFPVVQHQNQEGRLRTRKADCKRLENPCFRRWPDASVYGHHYTSDFCERSRLGYS